MTQRARERSDQYETDLLGAPFLARTLPLRGGARATLVRAGEPTRERGLLYLHGYSDYFFQADHAQRLAQAAGVDFYALDLRRYGRSLRPGERPGEVSDLAHYDEEIGRALEIIREEGHTTLTLLGHSTGGLIATLYAYHHPRDLDAVILNSPWYDINDTPLARALASPIAATLTRFAPNRELPAGQGHYSASIHRSTGGEWDFDLTLKPLEGFPVRPEWLRAIRRGQAEVATGTPLPMPVLMCTSSRSGGVAGRTPTPEELRTSDCVLNVAHMWRAVPSLGANVTLRTIPGGLHDLALSAQPPREDYVRTVSDWLARHVA